VELDRHEFGIPANIGVAGGNGIFFGFMMSDPARFFDKAVINRCGD